MATVVTMLSVLVVGGVFWELMQPVMTLTPDPICGIEAHTHGNGCFENVLVCTLVQDENHTHDSSCYEEVLTCILVEHTHSTACYPETVSEPTLIPPATEAALEDATTEPTGEPTAAHSAETTTEPTGVPEGEPTAEPEEQSTAEPTGAPEGELATEPTGDPLAEPTPEPTKVAPETTELAPENPEQNPLRLEALELRSENVYAGQIATWAFEASEADDFYYEISTEQGVIASGVLSAQERELNWMAEFAGNYVLTLTARRGEETLSLTSHVLVSEAGELVSEAGELVASIWCDERSCFGGDSVTFGIAQNGGVEPITCAIVAKQDGVIIAETNTYTGSFHVDTVPFEYVTDVCVEATFTDALGNVVTATFDLPCAVKNPESTYEWEKAAEDARKENTGVWPEDLLAVAKSQLGCEESKISFIVDEEGNHKGYTLYGARWHAAYQDWCAMYVSFCLEYADIPELAFPREANCEKWISALKQMDLYSSAEDYIPQPGDLIFFDWEEEDGSQDERAEHIGIVAEVTDDEIITIEGNSGSMVRYRTYDIDAKPILGYGLLNLAYERDLAAKAEAVDPDAPQTFCGMEEHIHGEDCYDEENTLICELPEHVHTLACYSDPNADVEAPEQWEATMQNVSLTGLWADDLLAIAETQLGYTESTNNYTVMEDGFTKKGYTRYGDWFGNRYEDWNAMYVSFCLRYAAIPQQAIPSQSDYEQWIVTLKEMGLIIDPQGYQPEPGDIVFMDQADQSAAGRVGIVKDVAGEDSSLQINTIEGDRSDCVQYDQCAPQESGIVGYVSMAQAQAQYDESLPAEKELFFRGEDYTITLFYTDEAQLPEEATLQAREILPDTDEHAWYYQQMVEKMLLEESLEAEEELNLVFTRIFDIKIMLADEVIEPAAPVRVEILYDQPIDADMSMAYSSAHFTDNGVELIPAEPVEGENGITGTLHTQDSFSITTSTVRAMAVSAVATYYELVTSASQITAGEKYLIVYRSGTSSDYSYYALGNYVYPTLKFTVSGTRYTLASGSAEVDNGMRWQIIHNSSNTKYGITNFLGTELGADGDFYLSAVSSTSPQRWRIGGTTSTSSSSISSSYSYLYYYNSKHNYDRSYASASNTQMIILREVAEPEPLPHIEHDVDMTVDKTIDYLGDGVSNPDTDYSGDSFYRLYLDTEYIIDPIIDLLIVVDVSNSMGDNGGAKAVEAFLNGENGFLQGFLNSHPDNLLAIMAFSSAIYDTGPAYKQDTAIDRDWGQDGSDMKIKLATETSTRGGTNYAAALYRAEEMLNASPKNGHAKMMIFLSDGAPTFSLTGKTATGRYGTGTTSDIKPEVGLYTRSAVNYFNYTTSNVEVHSIAFGDTFDTEYLEDISTDNYVYIARSASELLFAFNDVLYPKKAVIQDELSIYAQTSDAYADFKLTMRPLDDNVSDPLVLYEHGDITPAGVGIIKSIDEKPMIYVPADVYQIDPMIVAPAVAAPMLLILLIFLLVRYRKRR